MDGKNLIIYVVFALLTANLVHLKISHTKSSKDATEYKELLRILEKIFERIEAKEGFSKIREDLLLIYDYMVDNASFEVNDETTIQDFLDSMDKISDSGEDYNQISSLIQLVINGLNNSGVNMFCTLSCCLLDKYCSGNNLLIG